MPRQLHRGNRGRRNASSSYKKSPLLRTLEYYRRTLPNRTPVIRQIRAFRAKRYELKRRIKGNLLRAATLGYVKPLSHKSLKPCTGVRKQIRKAYFGFKHVKNWKRGGNRTKIDRKRMDKSRFTVLNCK
jgi:hypothetical protein